jgi:FecR protein
MAIQPPVAPAATTPAPTQSPQATKGGGCAGRGCGFGCGGCLIAAVLAVLLVVGGGWYFLVIQASAAVTAPATLILFNQSVTVNQKPGTPGQSLNAGDDVKTDAHGHAAIQFPDGSIVRMASNSEVQITRVQLQRTGNLQAAEVTEKVGRTLTNVQHLASGATFMVDGHSVSAEVRGTEFELLVRPDNTQRLWVFVGSVKVSGKTSVTVTAGQEVDIDGSGNLSNQKASQFDPQDPFPMNEQCSATAASGSNPGTMQTSTGDVLTNGQSAEQDYYSPGGNLNVAFCYPGSLMLVTVTDPSGRQFSKQGAPPVKLTIPNGPPGIYRAVVRALNVPATGEAYSVVFATDVACVVGDVDTGSAVRKTLSTSQIANDMAQAGIQSVSIQVRGTSPGSARIYFYASYGPTTLEWTVDFYSATPNLGAVVTQVTLNGINVTPQVLNYLGSAGPRSISAIPQDFIVDRLYSCAGPGGDNIMVIEGHR